MRLLTLPLVALLALTLPTVAKADAPARSAGAEVAAPDEGWIWQALPLAELSRDFFSEMSSPDLRALVMGAAFHLSISEQIPELDQVDDLALLFRAATAVQMLESRAVLSADPQLRIAARTLAYFCFHLGMRYEADPTLRQNLDRLPAIVNPASRPVAEALLASIRGARAFSRKWFPRAFAAEVGDRSPSPSALSQLGAFHRDDGRLLEAWEAFAKTIALQPKTHTVINAFEVLLKMNTEEGDRTAAELRDKAVSANPILANRFDHGRTHLLRLRETAAWRADPKPLELADAVSLADSLTAEGALDEAEQVVKDALARHKDDPEAWSFAGSFHSHQRHAETLRNLFIDAEKAGMMTDRMRELRYVALSESRLAEIAGTPAVLDNKELLAADRTWLEGRGPHEAFIAAAGDLLVILTRVVTAERRDEDDDATEAARRDARKAVTAITKRFGDRPEAWRLAFGAHSGLGDLDKHAPALRRGVQRVKGPEGLRLRAELERLIASRALTRRDPKLIAQALKELSGLEVAREREAKRLGAPFPMTDEERAIERSLFVQLAAVQADMRPGPHAWRGAGDLQSFQDAFKALHALRERFDESTSIGRTRAQCVLTTLASLAERPDVNGSLETLWKEVRFNRADPYLRYLAAAKLMELGRFADGALDFATRALDAAEIDDARHHSLLMTARLKQLRGDQGARDDYARALALWDETDMPDAFESSALRPISFSTMNFSIQVSHTRSIYLEVLVEPIVALVSEPPASRSAIQAMLDEASAE